MITLCIEMLPLSVLQLYYSIQLNCYKASSIIILIVLMLLVYKISQINEAINYQSIALTACQK